MPFLIHMCQSRKHIDIYLGKMLSSYRSVSYTHLGVKQGFDLEMLEAVSRIVNVPVIASGGAGCAKDFITLFQTLPNVDAGLAASIFHFGEVAIPELKRQLAAHNITVRL